MLPYIFFLPLFYFQLILLFLHLILKIFLQFLLFEPKSQLTNVIIADGVEIPKDINLGIGVRFTSIENIPTDVDLTNTLPNIKTIISHGSNQSNAMYSLSVLAKLKGWKFIYYTNHIPKILKQYPHEFLKKFKV